MEGGGASIGGSSIMVEPYTSPDDDLSEYVDPMLARLAARERPTVRIRHQVIASNIKGAKKDFLSCPARTSFVSAIPRWDRRL